jgi:hypothetical protein
MAMGLLRRGGWIMFHRVEMDEPSWKQLTLPQHAVWLTIRVLANVKPKTWFNGKTMEMIPRGSFVTSQGNLAAECKRPEVTRQVVRDALKNLEAMGEIRTHVRTRHSTLIQVMKYEGYATGEPRENQQLNQEGTKGEPQLRSREVEKKRREEAHTPRVPLDFESEQQDQTNLVFKAIWSVWIKKERQKDALAAWNALRPSPELAASIRSAAELQTRRHGSRWREKKCRYAPQLSIWLSEARWEDVVPPALDGIVDQVLR